MLCIFTQRHASANLGDSAYIHKPCLLLCGKIGGKKSALYEPSLGFGSERRSDGKALACGLGPDHYFVVTPRRNSSITNIVKNSSFIAYTTPKTVWMHYTTKRTPSQDRVSGISRLAAGIFVQTPFLDMRRRSFPDPCRSEVRAGVRKEMAAWAKVRGPDRTRRAGWRRHRARVTVWPLTRRGDSDI